MAMMHALGIDIETTGTNPAVDAVVELAAVGLRFDPVTGDHDHFDKVYRTVVDPGRSIPPGASRRAPSHRSTRAGAAQAFGRATKLGRGCASVRTHDIGFPQCLFRRGLPSRPCGRADAGQPVLGLHATPRTACVARRARAQAADAPLLAGMDAGGTDDGGAPGLVRCGVQRPPPRGHLLDPYGRRRCRLSCRTPGTERHRTNSREGAVRQAPGKALVRGTGRLLSLDRGKGGHKPKHPVRSSGRSDCPSGPPRGVRDAG